VEREIELIGGRVSGRVVRIGDIVYRPVGPWTPTVHAYLEHLERRGFGGAPRALGFDDQGRQMLSFVEGVVASSSTWTRGHANRVPAGGLSDEALVEVGRMIRSLHDAAADFRPVDPVYAEDGPVAFIDWDGARPNEPLLALGHAAWWYVPLMDDAFCREMGFTEPPDRGRRLRAFVDAYGADPGVMLDAIREAKQREAERPRYWPGMTATIVAEFLSHIVRELEWLAANEHELRAALR
jgi:hypothetical protein